MKRDEIGAIRYAIRSVDYSGPVSFTPYIDGNVVNQDSNYDEKFWDMEITKAVPGSAYLKARTRKTGFVACMAMGHMVELNGSHVENEQVLVQKENYVSNQITLELGQGEEVILYKFVSVLSSMNHESEDMVISAVKVLAGAMAAGFEGLFKEHVQVWEEKWAHSDIVIEGDTSAQQGIRFNIFQLNQTYTGTDERLNIGPKGFTGEKYGGSTYWDTEAYMIPFYLSTARQEVSRNLLVYRYKHLAKAIENAIKLGFTGGAALYPMVTMNGEECHNEWEITFEEIHRNGAIAFAILISPPFCAQYQGRPGRATRPS